jgi:hypothetical protein
MAQQITGSQAFISLLLSLPLGKYALFYLNELICKMGVIILFPWLTVGLED